MKILVIQTAFIGDVVLATSFVKRIHQLYPQAEITFLLRKGNETLFVHHPHIKKIVIWDKKKKWKSFFSIIKELRSTKFDYLFNLQRYFTTGLFSLFLRADQKIGFHNNPLSFFFDKFVIHKIPHLTHEKKILHEVSRNDQLLQVGFFAPEATLDELKPEIFLTQKEYNKVAQWQDQEYIVMAPSSVWFTKMWPLQNWKDLVKKLKIKILIIGSPEEFKRAEEIKADLSHVENLCGKLSLIESAALIQKARVAVVNDSAVLHIASAMNTPTLAIFCSTIKEFGYFPLSDQNKVFEVSDLKCRPCGLHGHKTCPKFHFDCAKIDNLLLESEIKKYFAIN